MIELQHLQCNIVRYSMHIKIEEKTKTILLLEWVQLEMGICCSSGNIYNSIVNVLTSFFVHRLSCMQIISRAVFDVFKWLSGVSIITMHFCVLLFGFADNSVQCTVCAHFHSGSKHHSNWIWKSYPHLDSLDSLTEFKMNRIENECSEPRWIYAKYIHT